MDLTRHLQVLWRFRLILALGVLLGVLLAILASFKVSFDGGPNLTWRSSQTFESSATLFVTQPGFPWGRVNLPAVTNSTDPAAQGAAAQEDTGDSKRREYGVPERFSDLAVLYAYLAGSEQVRELMRPRPRDQELLITPLSNPGTGAGLPLLKVDATGSDPARVQALSLSAVAAVKEYLKTQQERNGIEAGARVEIQVLNSPSKPFVTVGHGYMGSVIAFILMVALAVGLIYLLENLKPGTPRLAPADAEHSPANGNVTAVSGPRRPSVPTPPSVSSWDGPSKAA